jgi:hypothetical protein
MENHSPTRRRWTRYSLRTLFVLLTLVCVYLGWAMNWIRQRREFLNRPDVASFEYASVRAPGTLWLFGEKGVEQLIFYGSEEEMERAEKLFPEAELNPFICGTPFAD